MGAKPRPKYIVLVKPKRAWAAWPRDHKGKALFVTLDKDGFGWSAGIDLSQKSTKNHAEALLDFWLDDNEELQWLYEIRAL